jgi:hypothetical protein
MNSNCHTVDRTSCITRSQEYKNYRAQYANIRDKHLFYNSVSCAKKIFGPEDTSDPEPIELKIGENELVSGSDGFQYFRLGAEKTGAYQFQISFENEHYALAYDFLDCHGRKEYSKTPDMTENYCFTFENISNPDFIAFEPQSPIYLSIRFSGKVKIKVTPHKFNLHN